MKTLRPISHALFARFLAIALLPILIGAVYVSLYLLPGMQRELEAEARATQFAISERLYSISNDMNHLLGAAQVELSVAADRYEREQVLRDMIRYSTTFVRLTLTDAQGRIEASALSDSTDLVDISQLQQILNRTAGEPGSGVKVINISNRMVGIEQRVDGRRLLAEYPLDRLDHFMAGLDVGRGWKLVAGSYSGRVVYSYGFERFDPDYFTPLTARSSAASRGELQRAEIAGHPYFIGAFEHPFVRVWLLMSADDAYQKRNGTLATMAVAMLLSLLLAVMMSASMSRRVANRNASFLSSFAAIAEGNYEGVLASPNNTEEAAVVEAFEHMQHTLREREQQLQYSERSYREIFEATSDGILVYDYKNDRMVDANRRFYTLLELDARRIKGMPLLQGYFAWRAMGDNARYRELFKAAEAGKVVQFEIGYTLPQGNLIDLEVTLHGLQLQSQQHLVMTLRDRTEHKQRERQIRLLQSYINGVIDSIPAVIIGVDDAALIKNWNLHAELITGVSARAAVGKPLQQLVQDYALLQWLSISTADGEQALQSDRLLAMLSKVIKYRESEGPLKIKRQTGSSLVFYELYIYPVIGDHINGAVIHASDVTQRMRMEEVMVQTEKMISVGGLAAGMAHEINNPLAGIMQNVQVLSARLDPALPKNSEIARQCDVDVDGMKRYMQQRDIQQIIGFIQDSGQRAARVVKSMLSFARKADADRAPVDPVSLLDRSIELARNDYDMSKRYDFKHVEIVKHYQADMPQVFCEEVKIEQVLLNLLRNAAQAMFDADTQQPRITVNLSATTERVRFEICDNGPGMPEAVQKRVFEPFYTTKAVGAGTGLGLSVSYFIVCENHGGSMWVESSEQGGCMFVFELPLRTRRNLS